jgi:cytochrome c biogenesis protein CcmG/thiol:disulfide interchange protein DsbE
MNVSKSTWLLLGMAALLLGGVLSLVWRRGSQPLAVGDKAPSFSLQSVDATAFTFKDAGHHVVLVNFWASWCPPCVEETPSLEKFSQRMSPFGVRVISISVDQNLGALKKFISDYHLTYPVLRDPNQTLAARFGTYKFPETYIFDRNGRLADKIIGATDWEDPRMAQFVEALVHWPPAMPVQKAAAENW